LVDLAACTIYCKVDTSLDHDSDHLPIAIAIDWSWQPATLSKKRLWTKTNLPLLRQMVKNQIRPVPDVAELRDNESIDEYTQSIIEALNTGINALTPWSNLSLRSILGFDQECKDICAEV
jgi:hypothetical protein